MKESRRKKSEIQYREGKITYEEYEEKARNLKKIIDHVCRTNKAVPDKNNKRIYENVTKAINSAMKVIKSKNEDLYEHLRDAAAQKKHIFRYASQATSNGNCLADFM